MSGEEKGSNQSSVAKSVRASIPETPNAPRLLARDNPVSEENIEGIFVLALEEKAPKIRISQQVVPAKTAIEIMEELNARKAQREEVRKNQKNFLQVPMNDLISRGKNQPYPLTQPPSRGGR